MCRVLSVFEGRDFVGLARDTVVVVVGEAFHSIEDGLGVEVGFGDDVGLGAAGQPLVVPVGGQGVLVGQRSHTLVGPHPARARGYDHEVVSSFRGEDGVLVRMGLPSEELLADGRDDLDVDPLLGEPG